MPYSSFVDIPSPTLPKVPTGLGNLALGGPSARLQPRRLSLSRDPRARAASGAETGTAYDLKSAEQEFNSDVAANPVVEQTIKAFVNDLQRCGQWTLSRFAQGVEYNDSFRAFVGREKYARSASWVQQFQNPKVEVNGVKMINSNTAVLNWTLTGRLHMFDILADCESTISMHVLTGQITEHRDRWSLVKSGLPAYLAFFFSRVMWAAGEASADTREQVDKLSHSLTTPEEVDGAQGESGDATKPFPQLDSRVSDALETVSLAALMYVMYRGWFVLFTMMGMGQ